MSFLKNIIRNGISDGINKGISKGITNAVGKAVEKFVNPAAEKLAGQAAQNINETTQALETANEAVKENPEGFEALENALGAWAKSAEKAAKELEEQYGEQKTDVLEKWDELFPGFPKWSFGGTDFYVDDNGTNAKGEPYTFFHVSNTSVVALDAYAELLKQNGFVRKYPGSDETLYREEADGAYLIFNETEAMSDDTTMSIAIWRSHDKSDLG